MTFFSIAAICQDTGLKHWSNNGGYFVRHCSNRNPGALTHECDSSQGSGYILNPILGNSSCFDSANTFGSFLYNVFPALPEPKKFQFQQHMAGTMRLVLVFCSALGLWCQLRDNVTGSANIPSLLENGEHSFLPATKPCSLP